LNVIDKDFIGKLISDVEEAINIISQHILKPFKNLTRPERSEIRYYIIVLAEALTAIGYHIVRRFYSIKPETPIHSFRILVEKDLMTESEFNDIVMLLKLRNLLVHRYWVIDDKRIYNEAKKNFKNIITFIERIRDVFEI